MSTHLQSTFDVYRIQIGLVPSLRIIPSTRWAEMTSDEKKGYELVQAGFKTESAAREAYEVNGAFAVDDDNSSPRR